MFLLLNKIVNLSDYKSNSHLSAILKKVYLFVHQKNRRNTNFCDIKSYFYYLRLKKFLCRNISPNTPANSADTLNKNLPDPKSNNSTWIPPSSRHQTLDLFVECFKSNLKQKPLN